MIIRRRGKKKRESEKKSYSFKSKGKRLRRMREESISNGKPLVPVQPRN
jgi:hypothetical protein